MHTASKESCNSQSLREYSLAMNFHLVGGQLNCLSRIYLLELNHASHCFEYPKLLDSEGGQILEASVIEDHSKTGSNNLVLKEDQFLQGYSLGDGYLKDPSWLEFPRACLILLELSHSIHCGTSLFPPILGQTNPLEWCH
ncbi:hypothetical protein V8G54_018047 [Vigna mungo]|uniref:Uncharacterized protein n=1 Tax=Vigna mungo TaxID=3915 RepID=A0AAQ3N9E7_VIGMU